MAYRLTKFFLYLILVICISWAALIFSGPSLINYAAKHYFDATLKISGLEVSPKLRIYAARVDYAEADFGGLGLLSGYSRAVSLRLENLIGLNPRLHVSIGPSEVNGLKFNEFASEIFYSQRETTDAWNVLTQIKEVRSKDLKVEQLTTVMKVDTNLRNINSLTYDTQNVEASLPFKITAPSIVGEVANVVLDNYMIQSFQILSNKIETLHLVDSAFGDQLSFKNVSAFGNYTDKSLNYSITFGEVVMDSVGTLAKGISMLSNYSASVDKPEVRTEFTIDTLYLNSVAAIQDGGSISNIFGAALFNDSNLQSVQIDGLLNPIVIQNGGSFLVEVPASRLKVNLESPSSTDKNDVDIEISLDPNDRANLFLKADLSASFDRDSLMSCISQVCQMSELLAQYTIDAIKSKMTGRLYCKNIDCLTFRFSHSVETQNTAEFFNAISATNLINPMLLAYTFSEIMRGQKNGQGHIKEF